MFCKLSSVLVALLAMAVLAQSGCRNRCNQPCANPYQQFAPQGYAPRGYVPPQGFLPQGYNVGANGLIPAPATGALNIPSLTGNNTGSGLLNTGRSAPTAARTAELNRQNGWRATGDRSANSNNNPVNNNPASGSNSRSVIGNTVGQNQPTNTGNSVLARDDNRTQTNVPGSPNSANQGRVANASYGTSYIDSPNYDTTKVNETRDSTRVPTTDASGVRAPSQYYSRATGFQFAQQNPGAGFAGGQYVAPGQVAPRSGFIPGGFAANGFANTGFGNQGGFVPPQINPNLVVSQATATFDPYSNPSRSAEWRDRDPGTGQF